MSDLSSENGPFTARLVGPDYEDRKIFTHYRDAEDYAKKQLAGLEEQIDDAAVLGPMGELCWQHKAHPMRKRGPFPTELWCRACQKMVAYKIEYSFREISALRCPDCNRTIRQYFAGEAPLELKSRLSGG